MKNTSASALTWFAAILLFVGVMIMSPAGSFFVYVLAALFALAPAIFGTKKIRIIVVILLVLSIFLAVNKYPEFKSESDKYSRRGKISQINTGQSITNLIPSCFQNPSVRDSSANQFQIMKLGSH